VTDLTQEVRETVRQLFVDGKVKRVVGYERHPRSGLPVPCILTDPEQIDRLVLNPLCAHNVVNYVTRAHAEGPTAIIAKPCDTRAILVGLQENDLKREDVFVVAVGCTGIYDPLKVDGGVGTSWTVIEEIRAGADTLTVRTDAGEATLRAPSDLLDRCATCATPQPVVEDVRLGTFATAVPEREDPYAQQVAEIEAMSPAERRAYWEAAFSRCIRCYACRQVCPICSCGRCTADETQPQWIARSTLGNENELFLTLRAYHLAGRCTLCGACQRACPMDLPLMRLNAKMAREVAEMFAHAAGTDPDSGPPLARFVMSDPELPGHGGEGR
jgi:formate dehydrogenase (coenzyme F420) beta subunit